MALVDDILAKFQEAQQRANEANLERYRQGLSLYDQIIGQYSPGGTFGQGVEAQLGRSRTKALAQGTQALVSAGLAGTTKAATLGRQFEEEVAVPARLRMEDIRQERLAEARRGKAGFMERREDVGPDYRTIAGLAQQAGTRRKVIPARSPRYWGSSPEVGTDFFKRGPKKWPSR